MRSFYLSIIIAGVLVVAAVTLSSAQDPFADLTYPIPELGNCESREACDAYCAQPENMEVCISYAEAHNLLSEEEIEMGRRMLAAGQTAGPGGCVGQQQCEAYCDNIDHIKECIEFAEEHGLIPPDELDEARKVIAAIDKGLTPPPCKGKSECDIYCSQAEHMEECIEFGIAAGLMPPDEIEEAKKVLAAIKKGIMPPPCAGEEECDIYCSTPDHMQECIEFGIAAGLIPADEIEDVKKMLQVLKQGIKPPNCRGEAECDIYCSSPEHMAECMEFAMAAGFMPADEIENARRTLEAIKQGIMPPNCQGEVECEIYCSSPEHMAECMEFSIAAGFIPAEEAEQAKRMLQAIKQGIMPPNCRGEQECQIYCQQEEHRQECINFAVAIGEMTPEEAERSLRGGPGGCRNEQECQAYCQDPAHLEECLMFYVEMGEMTPQEAEQILEQMRMMEQAPPEMMEEGPQSFLDPFILFLGSLLKATGF